MTPAAAAAGAGPVPVPAGWRLRADGSLRRADDGRVLSGGRPFRVLRLSAAGAAIAAGWLAGAPVGPSPGERALARRLLDAGLAHPDVEDGAVPAGACTVVIPVRGRPHELRRCLESVADGCPVIVVDDGSPDPGPVAAAAAEHGARLVRLSPGRGPAAARNAGLACVATPFVAFVDSDCVLPAGFPGRLLAHLADPAVAVAAPRIVALEAPRGLLESYEAAHSALDMGAAEALVRPGTAVPYVPSAALVARVAALGGGFDEALRLGEDVDLLWRLHAAGWQSRYDPAVRVGHDHRVRWRAWFARRVAYNAATAPLHTRHPGAVPALVLPRAGAGFWAAVLLGRPRVAAVCAVADVVRVRRRLAPQLPHAGRTATRLVAEGRAREGRELARTLAGPWLPLLLVATATARAPGVRRRLWTVVAAGVSAEWATTRAVPSPVHHAAGRLADDAARGVGVWLGALRHRTLGPLALRIR